MKALTIPLLLAAAVAASAVGFDQHVADVTLLQSKPVQTELKVTEAQRAKMNVAAGRHSQVLKALDAKYKGKKIGPAELKAAEPQLKASFDRLKREVLAALTPAQVKRLAQINLQRLNYAALTDQVVATQVGMSAVQLKSFRTVFVAGGQSAAKIQRGAVEPILAKYRAIKPKDQNEAKTLQTKANGELQAAGRKVAPALAANEAATKKKLDGILGPTVRAKFEALKGKPFRP